MPSPPISAHSAAGFLPIIPGMRPQPPLRPRLLCTTWLRRAGGRASAIGHRQPTIIYHGNISSLPPPEPTAAASPTPSGAEASIEAC